MSEQPEKTTRWLRGFVLPLVAGGDVRVHGVVGQPDLDELVRSASVLDRGDEGRRIAEARHSVVAEVLLDPYEPELDDEALKLAAAMQNLLFLSHPSVASPMVRKSRLGELARWTTALLDGMLPPENARQLAERHSMLHHLFDLGRDDVRVSFWAGRREYKGSEPPSRLLKWATVRRVHEERWRVSFVSEAVNDVHQRAILLSLLNASPLTDLYEPLRLDPPFDLDRLTPWLREPAVARAVADRYLTLGLHSVAPPLTAALLSLFSLQRRPDQAKVATRFLCHLHLLTLLGRSPGDPAARLRDLSAQVIAQPNLKDFYGLFAAAQRVGLGRPDDAARYPPLEKAIDAHAATCVTLCGAQRIAELEALVSRGTSHVNEMREDH